MHKEKNIWMDRFNGLDDPRELGRRVIIPANPFVNIQDIPVYSIRSDVTDALASFYLPSDADLHILMSLLERARAHCRHRYPNLHAYLSDLYRVFSQFDTEFIPPQCLTGPAGVGKSALMRAFGRALPLIKEVDFGNEHPKGNLVGLWHIEVRDRSTLKAMLMPFVEEEFRPSRRVANSDLNRICAKALHRDGVTTLGLDELQFLTQSPSASTVIAKTIYQLAYLGVPSVFVANYSLCRLLQKREEQDRQRLMTSPFILLPPSPSSDHWLEYLKQLKIVLGQSLQIEVEKESGTIYQLTAGLKRLTIHLVSIAYENVWRQGRRQVYIDDLASAYEGIDFAVNRKQVQDMLLPHPSRYSKNYECPFPLPLEEKTKLAQIRKEVREKALLDRVQQEIKTTKEKERSKGKQSVSRVMSPPESEVSRKSVRRKPVSPNELFETESHRRGKTLYPRRPPPPG